MVAAEQCPDESKLQTLALGLLSPEEVEQLAGHCEKCDQCVKSLQSLQSLQVNDALIQTMRSGATTITSAQSEEPLVQALIQKFTNLHALNTPTISRVPLPDQDSAVGSDTETIEPSRQSSSSTHELEGLLAPAESPDELGRLENYRILGVLGAGGMGTVFLAEDLALKRKVALKVMKPVLAVSPTARQRFLREAQMMAAVQHDHIIHINQVGQTGQIPFLAMPFLQGETLEDRLLREIRLPAAEVARIGREIAEGLSAAHQQNLIHRDIKPANIWLEGKQGRVKILDFGLARATMDDVQLTQTGAIAGTPAYMSPEQAQGGPIDSRSDLFSLGCVLYRMVTGVPPFQGETLLQIIRAVENFHPPAPRELLPEIPEALSALIMQLLAKKADDRPASAEEVVLAIEQTQSSINDACLPTAVPPKFRRGRLAAAVVVAVLAILAPVVYWNGGTLIRIVTNHGVLVIESEDPNIEVTIISDSAVVYDKVKDRAFELSAGNYEVQVQEVGDNGVRFATKHFTITRGGTETFHARFEAPTSLTAKTPGASAPAIASPTDEKPAPLDYRALATWVLERGGSVLVNERGTESRPKTVAELPRSDFSIVQIRLNGREIHDSDLIRLQRFDGLKLDLADTPITDQGLVYLAGMKTPYGLTLDLSGTKVTDNGLQFLKLVPNLIGLRLSRTSITGAGLVHLRGLPLEGLHLANTKISESGIQAIGEFHDLIALDLSFTAINNDALKPLQKLKNLQYLYMISAAADSELEHLKELQLKELWMETSPITDAGLAHLEGMASLTHLGLKQTKVTDAGLTHLKGLKQLIRLDLPSQVTDAGLEHISGLPQLREISLERAPITGSGLKHLAGLPELEKLDLRWTLLDDNTLKYFHEFQKLRHVDLSDTLVTARGIQELKAALPGCNIIYPLAKPGVIDKRALAKWVIEVGGSILVNARGRESRPKTADQLPVSFNVVSVSLVGLPIKDDDLSWLRGFSGTTLNLSNTAVTDQGLVHLKGLKELNGLNLSGTKVTGSGLQHLKTIPKLGTLILKETPVTDDDMEHLRGLQLQGLHLANTKITPKGVQALSEMTSLTSLGLSGSNITDEAVEPLKRLTNLKYLYITVAPVTDAGLEHLKDLKLHELWLQNTRVTDAGMAHFAKIDSLDYLGLSQTRITDAGLVHLKGLRHLTRLSLPDQVTDAGLEHIGGLTQLRELHLKFAEIKGPGLAHLAGLAELEELVLSLTFVDDKGLKHLHGLKNLKRLYLIDTAVTEVGIQDLQAVLPNCTITYK